MSDFSKLARKFSVLFNLLKYKLALIKWIKPISDHNVSEVPGCNAYSFQKEFQVTINFFTVYLHNSKLLYELFFEGAENYFHDLFRYPVYSFFFCYDTLLCHRI